MCIAIANLKGKPLSDEEIGNCWANNPDGAGILYKENGILKVYKNLDNLSKFLKKYKKVIQNSNCLVHFRVTTRGGVNVENIHPFMVHAGLGFIHNGVINAVGNVEGRSDTWSFNQEVLKNLPEGFLNSQGIRQLVEDYIGYSKLAFMDLEEEFTIMNAAKGTFLDNGNWVSNSSYKQVNNFKYAGNKKVYNKDVKTNSIIPYSPPKKYPSHSDYMDTYYSDFYNASQEDLLDEIKTNDEPWTNPPDEMKDEDKYISEICDILDGIDTITLLGPEAILAKVEITQTRKDDMVYICTVERAIQYINQQYGCSTKTLKDTIEEYV